MTLNKTAFCFEFIFRPSFSLDMTKLKIFEYRGNVETNHEEPRGRRKDNKLNISNLNLEYSQELMSAVNTSLQEEVEVFKFSRSH